MSLPTCACPDGLGWLLFERTSDMTLFSNDEARLRYSVSLVTQGSYQFYTLTMPSDVLARTCAVSTRQEDPQKGFQRTLDERRALEIAQYIDSGHSIPNSIVLSAQEKAKLKVIGRGKTLEFSDTPGAFLILDGQHRVYGFSKSRKPLRVPVVIYNNLTRQQESRLFIDINTKQRAVPGELLLDIKKLADIERAGESELRELFDVFHSSGDSALKGLTSPFDKGGGGKITRVTFNAAIKPLLENFSERPLEDVYRILNSYLLAVQGHLPRNVDSAVLGRPVVFRALIGLFPVVAQRVQDRFDGNYQVENFSTILGPMFAHMPVARLNRPGTSSVALRDYLSNRLQSKQQF